VSVAAHMLYETVNPYMMREPGGTIRRAVALIQRRGTAAAPALRFGREQPGILTPKALPPLSPRI